jgi:peptidyl-prolyl cis-trans isomerase B (cyclophilin B)
MTMEFKKIDPRVTITTKFGEIKIRFYPEDAPRHIENFINLIKMEFYNGTTFHRIVPGFVIQGGDPLSKEEDRLKHGSAQARSHLYGEDTERRIEHTRLQRQRFAILYLPGGQQRIRSKIQHLR